MFGVKTDNFEDEIEFPTLEEALSFARDQLKMGFDCRLRTVPESVFHPGQHVRVKVGYDNWCASAARDEYWACYPDGNVLTVGIRPEYVVGNWDQKRVTDERSVRCVSEVTWGWIPAEWLELVDDERSKGFVDAEQSEGFVDERE